MKSAKQFLKNLWTRIDAEKRGRKIFASIRAIPRPVVFIAVSAVVLLAVLIGCQTAATSGTSGAWSGFLEGKTVDVSPEVGGRITSVAVAEGDQVQSGQLIATIDDDLAKLRLDAADANVAAAQAQVALLEAGARAEDLQSAQARVDQARAARVAATQAVTDTEAIRANPQSLLIAQADADARAQSATFALTAAAKQAEGADLPPQFWQDQVQSMEEGTDVTLPGGGKRHFDTPVARIVFARGQWFNAGNAAWQAWAGVAQAQANLVAAQGARQGVSDQLTNPIALDTRVDQARAARDRAAANLQTAQAAQQVLSEGASPAQIQAARAALDQARAARASLAEELSKYRIVAPQQGTVAQVFYRPGETVAAAAPLVRLSVNGELTLRVFVPMSSLPQVHVGATVPVSVAELNSKPTDGTVARVADTAEFASRQAQTDSERNALLVAVEVSVQTANNQLKAGMPASVSFTPQAPGGTLNLNLLPASESLTFSGTLEAKQTQLAAEVSAQVVNVRVDKGATVNAGDALIALDDSTMQTNLREADAAVRVAQSNLDQVNEPARPGAVALATAAVTQANADLKAANAALDDANRALVSKQDIASQAQIWDGKARAAQASVGSGEATLASIKNQVDLAQQDLSKAGKMQFAILQKQQQAADAGLLAAQATLQGSKRVLEIYQQMLDQPLELIAAQHAAAGQVEAANAGARIAQAELDSVRRAPQPAAVALAQARLNAAKASQGLAQAQAKRYVIASPLSGTVVGRSVEVGDTTRPGNTLLTIADTRELDLTLFVPIRSLGALRVGQAASIRVPSLPGKSFDGTVTYIAPQSEFKPANIYNSQERSEMVFAVRVTVPNPNGEMKAGLPADAIFAR